MMNLQYLTFFTWLGPELVTVPGFPAWVCDVCGKREYDEKTVQWLATLLSPNTGKPPLRQPNRRRLLPKNRPAPRPKKPTE